MCSFFFIPPTEYDAKTAKKRWKEYSAQCDDIIAKLPQGIDTQLGTHGTYLSGGETQRIAIARALLKDAPIVILDEATAFADPENESLVQKAFDEMGKNKTVIMIAHRLSTVKDADEIFVLKDGKIVQSGTHDELLADNIHGKVKLRWRLLWITRTQVWILKQDTNQWS